MDSLTQIVLGAAVGEAALGKKIGNRAMIWGAIGGTIPDFDVLNNLYMNELDAMCSHRGITHSIFFSVVAPLAFAWLLSYLYRSGAYRSRGYKGFVAGLNALLIALIVFGVFKASGSFYVLTVGSIFGGYLIWRLYRYYLQGQLSDVEVSFREWYFLFFLAFFTHIALDCFTAYGTQVFLPFANTRVAFNTIAVADPLYTLPFLICTVGAAIARRGSRIRGLLNWSGIIVSSLYLMVTVFNHMHIHRVFDRALESRGIEATRTLVGPVILQNALWSCTAESDSSFHVGLYSIFDSNELMHYLNTLPKYPDAVAKIEDTDEYQRLYWFSNGYLQVIDRDSMFELRDLRYGPLRDTIRGRDDFVFRFELRPSGEGLDFTQARNEPEDIRETLKEFGKRVKGY